MAMPRPVLQVAPTVLPTAEPGPGDWVTYPVRVEPGIQFATGAGRLAGSEEGALQLVVGNEEATIDTEVNGVRHARLQTTIGATTYALFRGLLDDWSPTWEAVDSVINVTLVDAFSWLGNEDQDVDLPAQESHERINALLDMAGWPAALRDIADGVVGVEAIEQQQANLLQLLEDTADAEQGDLFISAEGKITFRSRHARFDTVPVITFGGVGNPGIESADPVRDLARVTTIARVELESGDVFEAIDDAAAALFGERVEPIRDLPLREAEAIALAQWEVHRFKDQHLWVDGLTVHGHEEGVLEAVLGTTVGDAARVLKTPLVGDPIDETFDVERISHDIGEGTWSVSFDLSPRFGDGPWFTWDDAANGWDSGARWAP